jgi:hypothetical protein
MTQHCPPKPVNESTGIMEWSEGLWKVLRTGTCLAVYATSPFKKWMDSQANENLSLDSWKHELRNELINDINK